MIGRLNHVAIVVPDLKSAADVYRNTLGAKVTEEGVTFRSHLNGDSGN